MYEINLKCIEDANSCLLFSRIFAVIVVND